jgi:hypothetical protein
LNQQAASLLRGWTLCFELATEELLMLPALTSLIRPACGRAGAFGPLLAAAMLAGCASPAPVIYRTPEAPAAQLVRIERDTTACRQQTDKVVGRNARDVAPQSARAAGVGFAAAAAATATAGARDTWKRARAGAAGGATGIATKVLLEWNAPDEVHEKYFERCMKDRGHEVLGWR